jgi:hypothetical protein
MKIGLAHGNKPNSCGKVHSCYLSSNSVVTSSSLDADTVINHQLSDTSSANKHSKMHMLEPLLHMQPDDEDAAAQQQQLSPIRTLWYKHRSTLPKLITRKGKGLSYRVDASTKCCIIQYSQSQQQFTQNLIYTALSDKPWNKSIGIGYFEVALKKMSGNVHIGVADALYDTKTPIGYYPHSYSFVTSGHKRAQPLMNSSECFMKNSHLKKNTNYGASIEWSPGASQDDVIGCGINFFSKQIFYTKNGVFLGACFQPLYKFSSDTHQVIQEKDFISNIDWHPAISLEKNNDQVTINFGQLPFKFDLEKLDLAKVLPYRTGNTDYYQWNNTLQSTGICENSVFMCNTMKYYYAV